MNTPVKVPSLSPSEAWKILQENARAVLIDVRSTMEYLMIGHPVGAVHISWMDEPDWDVNPHFVAEVRKLILGGIACHGDCPPIMLLCRSGNRSREAAETLIEAGFASVYNVRDGFEGPLDSKHHRSTTAGWRFEGLPWEQS